MSRETCLTIALLIGLAACAGPPAVPADPSSVEITDTGFQARATADGLELINYTDAPVYYGARDPLTLALSTPIPCLEPANCPRVPARSRVVVPLEASIVGYRPETQRVILSWWHFVRRPDGSVAADLVRELELVLGH